MEIVIVLASITFGFILGVYIVPFGRTEILVLRKKIDDLIKIVEERL